MSHEIMRNKADLYSGSNIFKTGGLQYLILNVTNSHETIRHKADLYSGLDILSNRWSTIFDP